MLEQLAQIDTALFRFINSTIANPVTDFLMPIVTSDWNLHIAFGLIMLIILIKGSTRLRWLVLFALLTVAATDQINSAVLKTFFDRTRPCHTLSDVHLLVNCGAGKSMPSSHSANSFGQAMLFALMFPRKRWYLFSIAAIIAFSRVFVGVHYPFDVIVGALVGMLLGWLIYLLYQAFWQRWSQNRRIA